MRYFVSVVFIALLCVSCTKEQAKRATYETLKNIQTQRCDDRLIDGCEEVEKFDNYQRQRQEVLGQEK